MSGGKQYRIKLVMDDKGDDSYTIVSPAVIKRRLSEKPRYLRKSRAMQRYIIVHPQLCPIIAMNLSAIRIQKMIRGFLIRIQNLLRNKRPYQRKHKQIKKPQKSAETLYEKYGKLPLSKRTGQHPFMHFCATKIQAAWKMSVDRRHFVYMVHRTCHVAAFEIQTCWKQHQIRLRDRQTKGTHEDKHTTAAIKVQRCWRAHMDRLIFAYFRDLVRFRQKGDPFLLLKALSPAEAQFVDSASGLHMRFRLGGVSWPPTIYFKIYTHKPVTDICSFAPRDYVADRVRKRTPGGNKSECLSEEEKKRGWYMRRENNGWRPISQSDLKGADDEIARMTRNKTIDYHHDRLIRRADLDNRRKQKKLAWLKKVYRVNANRSKAVENEKIDPISMERKEEAIDTLMSLDENADLNNVDFDWENEANELLEWCSELDFDRYQQQWSAIATTYNPEQDRR